MKRISSVKGPTRSCHSAGTTYLLPFDMYLKEDIVIWLKNHWGSSSANEHLGKFHPSHMSSFKNKSNPSDYLFCGKGEM